jgi:hypothetical protein
VKAEVDEEEPVGGAAVRNRADGEPNRGRLGFRVAASAGEFVHSGSRETTEERGMERNRRAATADSAGIGRDGSRRRLDRRRGTNKGKVMFVPVRVVRETMSERERLGCV